MQNKISRACLSQNWFTLQRNQSAKTKKFITSQPVRRNSSFNLQQQHRNEPSDIVILLPNLPSPKKKKRTSHHHQEATLSPDATSCKRAQSGTRSLCEKWYRIGGICTSNRIGVAHIPSRSTNQPSPPFRHVPCVACEKKKFSMLFWTFLYFFLIFQIIFYWIIEHINMQIYLKLLK